MTMGTLGFAVAQEGDTLNILYWQAVSTLNPYLSGGTKDIEGGSLVLEPLARYNELGEMVPWLVDEIPTVENGGVSEDLMSITWTLSEGLVWSDGTPVTSADVVFTWQYCTHPDAGCNALSKFTDVTNVEAVDDRTVVITFGVPKPFPYGPFVGAQSPIIQAAQFADCVGANAQNCTDQNFYPIGTGPYVVTNFLANDVVEFAANPNYREEGKPYFQRIVFKGGGDAESAARAVLETGEFDYAWNLQVVPQILDQMVAAGQGQLVVSFGTSVERIHINHTNPDSALGDMRSVWVADGSNGHPFLQVPEIWKAMSMAIDRDLIASQLYGAAGKATCNLLPAPAAYASPNNEACLVQDIAGANALLDGAGIVDSDGDGVREYNGIPLRVLYQTSTNAVRQATQALIKDWWAQIGIEAELRNIDAAVFFGNDLASPDTYGKFYADVEMFTNNYDGTDPEAYMAQWTCAEIAGPDNDYLGNNISRWCNPDYDALVAQMAQTGSLQERAALAIAMNDMIVQDGAMIGLVHRGDVSAISNSLEGVLMNSWDSELWNVADWTRSN
ncbi:MAG: peptide ABC transporter substrate-binding protein [Chloroflexi bacterium]|nr:peptide ABC transporter substrate-binding protein [Chloroflexota bacterium]MDL1916261.1 peptide ABC transporter substrate-binding protein [Anaerolineae bacterium CFX4]MEB2364903.1 peptide ABC transporter substrate-binding protein [Chloroflexota bacterium]RIK20581.1 MAG: peptide ABC transporter [Chloroflexota bacterium]